MTIPEWLVADVLVLLVSCLAYIVFITRHANRLQRERNDLLNQNVRLQNELRGKRKEVHRLKQSWN